jgi:hypothetical protein
MARIPRFESLDEAATFWDSHDFEDYVDDTESVTISVRLPRRQRTLTIPLDLKTYQRIAALAAKRGVRVDRMVSTWLKEKALAESTK